MATLTWPWTTILRRLTNSPLSLNGSERPGLSPAKTRLRVPLVTRALLLDGRELQESDRRFNESLPQPIESNRKEHEALKTQPSLDGFERVRRMALATGAWNADRVCTAKGSSTTCPLAGRWTQVSRRPGEPQRRRPSPAFERALS